MILRSKLTEELRDYQIRSQRKYWVALSFFSTKPQISTRSFGAQLLANAHDAAAAKNSQNQISLPCGGDGKKKVTVYDGICGRLYKFYKHQENLCRPRDYMSSQIEINAKMRSILVDWLIEVHHKAKRLTSLDECGVIPLLSDRSSLHEQFSIQNSPIAFVIPN